MTSAHSLFSDGIHRHPKSLVTSRLCGRLSVQVIQTSYRLHPDFNETLKSIWLHGSGPNTTSNSSAKYTYGVEFSECGNYILYHDITGMLLAPKLSKLATTLAVFQVRGSGSWFGEQPASCVSLLGHLERSTIHDYFAGWNFHPSLSADLHHYREVSKADALEFWLRQVFF